MESRLNLSCWDLGTLKITKIVRGGPGVFFRGADLSGLVG